MEILGLNLIKSIIIIAIILFYWKFVYYRYHKKTYTPISFFVVGGILFFIGLYNFIKGNIVIKDIIILYSICLVFLVVSFSFVIYAIQKHGLKKDVDITLTWTKKIFPFLPFWFWMLIAFPAIFFIMAATYFLIGPEHAVVWLMIFLAWIKSNLRLYNKEIVK